MAKKFRFRLEPLLKLRSREVDKARNELGRAVQARLAQDELIQQKTDYLQELLSPAGNIRISAGDLQARLAHRAAVEQEITLMKKKLQQLAEIEAQCQKKLTQTMMEEKAIEKLKEKKKEVHKLETEREEQIFLDDIAQRSGSSNFNG
jgi:flagellar export protein FliJ